jgi:hypothetical protein
MGDRAILWVEGASLALFIKYGGSQVAAFLLRSAPSMPAHDPDAAQAELGRLARLFGPFEVFEDIGPPPNTMDSTLSAYSEGDAGVFVIPAAGGTVRTFGGYGFDGDDEDDETELSIVLGG